ncbi:MAG: hypothetical protein ACR2QW_09835 [bacterium]
MKFTKLVDRFEKLIAKIKSGEQIEPEKLEKLQKLLADKKSRYEEKLESTVDQNKRRKLETRLNVVEAQLKKTTQLLPVK